MIKNIILSGGFYHGLIELGAFCQLAKQEYFCMKNIERIYGTSAGGMIAAMVSLKLPLEDIVDYAINRPWQKIININFMGAFQAKGFINRCFFEEMFSNILGACGLNINTTMKEVYAYSGIDLHLFSIELESFELIDISHETFPDLLLIDAVHMTSAVPYIIEPCLYNEKYYIDGGLVCNYPLIPCLNHGGKPEETLGIKLSRNVSPISSESNIFEYAYTLHTAMGLQIEKYYKSLTDEISPMLLENVNELTIEIGNTSVDNSYNVFTMSESRKCLVNDGKKHADNFLSKITI